MKYCGIELKGNEALLCCIQGSAENYSIIASETKKIGLKDSMDPDSVRVFFQSMHAFLDEQKFDKVGIKARATKGRFSGGSVSFKMEGLIQLTPNDVQIINGATIKAKLKSIVDSIDYTEVKAYQKEALHVALYLALCS